MVQPVRNDQLLGMATEKEKAAELRNIVPWKYE